MSKRLTCYQRIMRAAKKGVGVRLSADEAFQLSMDDAVMQVAQADDEEAEPREHPEGGDR